MRSVWRRRLYSRTPILIPRWVLTGTYLSFTVLAALVGLKGLNALDFSRWDGYTPLWCLALVVGSVVAAYASLKPEREKIEKWAAAWVTGWLAVVLVVTFIHAASTSAAWFYMLLVTVLPAGRAVHLFRNEST